ncbi:MAG: hypothetical protein JXR91_13530 [Deltaproteobacteria bacterium]|nr:hypothetical protein [Deltaproteobacteria bacterium]
MIIFRFIFLTFFIFLLGTSCTDNGSGGSAVTNQTDDTSKISEHNESGSVCSNLKCEADLEAANSYFIKGDFKNAFEQYKCGDSAEAAAGAALSKTFMLLESDEATSLLKDLGIDEPFPAKDMFGPDGIIARIGKQVNGTGSFKLTSPGISIDDNFENIHFHETNYETGISIGVSDDSSDIVPADDSIQYQS